MLNKGTAFCTSYKLLACEASHGFGGRSFLEGSQAFGFRVDYAHAGQGWGPSLSHRHSKAASRC